MVEPQLIKLVMGSIVENRYHIVSIPRYPPKNPHHELYIHKLVMYFEFRMLNFLDFFNICPIS